MLFIPDSKWYAARLERKRLEAEDAERKLYRAKTIPTLSPSLQERYARLNETFHQIEAQRGENQDWFQEAFDKLDYLQEKFVMFGAKQMQFQAYLEDLRRDIGIDTKSKKIRESERHRTGETTLRLVNVTDHTEAWVGETVADIQAFYEREREGISQEREAETDPTTQLVLQKRLDVLQRRDEFVGKIGKILTNLNHQLRLVEDTFGLINDELRARSPEQILADVEEVVIATESMSETLEEIASVEQMIARVAS